MNLAGVNGIIQAFAFVCTIVHTKESPASIASPSLSSSSSSASLPPAPCIGPLIAGVSPEEHRAGLYDRVFNGLLLFWDKGGCDYGLGGIMCELDDDGRVVDDQLASGALAGSAGRSGTVERPDPVRL